MEISSASQNSLLSWEGEPRFFRRHRFSLLWGVALLLGWSASLLATAPAARVLSLLEDAARYEDSGYLFFAAGVLVLVNTARAELLYVGWFFTADGMAALLEKGPLLSLCIAALAIPLSYSLPPTLVTGTMLHFGVPALFGIATVILLQYLIRDVPGHLSRALALGLLLFSFQWLDVIPLLSPYGFGGGELSMAVKQMALLLEREDLLNLLGGIAFLTVLAGGAVTTELLVGWNRQILQLRHIRTQERELARLREERLRSRSDRETQQLVHDLKRPLTAILGLADVMRASAISPVVSRHLEVVQSAGESMEQMVREILRPDSMRILPAEEVLAYALSQASALPFYRFLKRQVEEEGGKSLIRINLIRFSRALVNVLDNAFRAAPEGNPVVKIALKKRGESILFRIEDNGPGFTGPLSSGISGWGSTGLGLAFVEEVLREHRGSLTFENPSQGGTAAVIALPKHANPEKNEKEMTS